MLGIINIIDLIFSILEKSNASIQLVAQILASGKAIWASVKVDFQNIPEPTLEQLASKCHERRTALQPEPEPTV